MAPVVGCEPPSTRRAVRNVSSSFVTAWRRSSSVALASGVAVPQLTPNTSRGVVGQWGGAGGACCEDHLGLSEAFLGVAPRLCRVVYVLVSYRTLANYIAAFSGAHAREVQRWTLHELVGGCANHIHWSESAANSFRPAF